MRVLVATAMYPTPENPAFGSFVKTQVECLQEAGVDVELLVLQGRIRKLIYPRGVFQLRRRLARSAIDLVHAHFSYVGMVARMQYRAPLVVTYHGDDLLGTVGDLSGRHTWFSRGAVKAGQALGRMADACIVQSEEMAAKLSRRACVYRVPHEVDFERFRPTERAAARQALGLDAQKKYLLFAANPQTLVKRYALARDVAAELMRREADVELLVVYKEPQERLAQYMSACDALVFTSFQEGSPNIVKQAMACNLPIVSTDVGDVRQVIEGTRWCYICPADAAHFADRLEEIFEDRPRTDGREQIRHFDRPLVAQRLIEVYEETLRRFHARQGVVRQVAAT